MNKIAKINIYNTQHDIDSIDFIPFEEPPQTEQYYYDNNQQYLLKQLQFLNQQLYQNQSKFKYKNDKLKSQPVIERQFIKEITIDSKNMEKLFGESIGSIQPLFTKKKHEKLNTQYACDNGTLKNRKQLCHIKSKSTLTNKENHLQKSTSMKKYVSNNEDDSLDVHKKKHQDIMKILQSQYGNSKVHSRCHTTTTQLECTFKPAILKKSAKIAQNLKPSFERLTAQTNNNKKNYLPYQADKQIKRYSHTRIQQLSQPRKPKPQPQEQLPPFRPVLSKKSFNYATNEFDIASRTKIWLQQKQSKINKLRQEQQQQRYKKQDCTYNPKIIEYKGQSDVYLSNFGKEGIANYFQRINLMKKKDNINKTYKSKNNNGSIKNTIQKQNKASLYSNKKSITSDNIKSSKKIQQPKHSYRKAVQNLHMKIMQLNL